MLTDPLRIAEIAIHGCAGAIGVTFCPGSIPDATFELQWETVGCELLERLRRGERVLVHCRGGLGCAGTVAARLLVELRYGPRWGHRNGSAGAPRRDRCAGTRCLRP